MNFNINEVTENDLLWDCICQYFPNAVKWQKDLSDKGDYHFFAVSDDQGSFLGGAVIDIGKMYFGPLADEKVTYLENLYVVDNKRRKGIGSLLLHHLVNYAWSQQAIHIRWLLDYTNEAAISFCKKYQLGIAPLEDPEDEIPNKQYLIIISKNQQIDFGW